MNNFKFFQYCTYTNTPVSKRQGYWLFRHKSSNKNAYRDNVLPVQSCPSATGNTLAVIIKMGTLVFSIVVEIEYRDVLSKIYL